MKASVFWMNLSVIAILWAVGIPASVVAVDSASAGFGIQSELAHSSLIQFAAHTLKHHGCFHIDRKRHLELLLLGCSLCASLSRISRLSRGGFSSNVPLADASSIILVGVLTEL
ncbi:hypothetical protein GQ457_06G008650 [Hibiscus cannabinus]